ncbi:MAG: hypothetical protein JST54_08430 [Deltaproteobacteria bacterium]|nr:hypothetical protein [Deltaproteobacteria bacterium]
MHTGLLLALWVATASPTPLPAARDGYVQAQGSVQKAHAQVADQQAQLDALSAEIAKAKAAGQPALFGSGELEHKLAQSQALSDQLAQSRAAEAARAQELEAAREKLYQALSSEIAARQGNGEASNVAALQKLESERAQVAPKAAQAVAAPKFTTPSDDPRELRERADALRDQADKLAKQQQALDDRIQAARDQQQLERHLRRLSGDDALFDESDRRVRVTHTDAPASLSVASGGATATAPATSKTASPPAVTASATSTPAASRTNTASASDSLSNNGPGTGQMGGSAQDLVGPTPTASAGSPSVSASPSAQEVPSVHSGELVRAEELSHGAATGDADEESLPALLKAREGLQKQRSALESQAKALEAQAAQR